MVSKGRKILIVMKVLCIALLACPINASMPSTVEIPPVDENQMQLRRSSHGQYPSAQRQFSYSHGSTTYQYGSQHTGYATAHLTNNGNGINHVAPNQQPECQNPLLRVFFKACHPPGQAPQSPVQCKPIPGQTSFRCFIKQMTWPAVRVAQCAPGTAFQNGECVPLVGSSGGTVVIPVAMGTPGGSQLIRSSTSTVYRHCSNGSCRTCIGDQCSTTGLDTPVSVDHRFRSNSATEVAAFGDVGRDVKQKCAGTICKTCIDRVCYDRSYPLLRVTAGCPPAVCDDNCVEFVYWTDQCPICRCRGFASREPCRGQSECPAGATCRNQVCIYAELSNSTNYDKVCTFSSQCPGHQLCYNWRCGAKPAHSRHLEDHSCAVDQDCPSGHICSDMTCWEGEADRFIGQACTLDHQCPTAYFCNNGSCSNVYHHGTFGSFSPTVSTVPPTINGQCADDRQCYGGESCYENRCVTLEERRRMDESRQRQQTQHETWRSQDRSSTTNAPDGSSSAETQHEHRTSADEEYERRMAEYNRRVAEQERQYEEQRRQMEEERRRQEEDVQRRRQDEQEAQRREELQHQRQRQQEEEQRRRDQENENSRIQENLEKQRREEEMRRNQEQQRREQEENQRRAEAQRRREDENRRRVEQDDDYVRPVPIPTPDIEIGEEMPEDTEDEYQRRQQEYNRELQERQRRLQEMDNEEISRLEQTTNLPNYAHVDQNDDDFYSRSRQRGRMFVNNANDRSLSFRYDHYPRRN